MSEKEEFTKDNRLFAALVSQYSAEPLCELDGHYHKDKPEHSMHDDKGVKWLEEFSCPTCDDTVRLLMCQTAHDTLEKWVEWGIDKPDMMICDNCDVHWGLLDVYYGGMRWG